jgi:hypothetical protein
MTLWFHSTSVLDLLQGEIVAKLKEWEKQTNARMYVMAVWAQTDRVLAGFE